MDKSIASKGSDNMIRVGVVGLGKMGLSHHAMINAHPRVSIDAVCDSAGYLLDILNKYTGMRTFTRYEDMLAEVPLDAVVISTPSRLHAPMVRAALERNIHVFCEKPLCLNTRDGEELTRLASEKGLVNQVGYHHRFIGTFREVKRLLDLGAIGEVTHMRAEAYGPVVLKSAGSTWRTKRSEGGSCLYDYAAHPLNLLNWYLGEPRAVGSSMLNKMFSSDTEDIVVGTLYFDQSKSAQIFVNWSDESYRKMSTKISAWGKNGSIVADRQEMQVYLRNADGAPDGYCQGWNVRYTTDLTNPVWFYLRGEEYSAQLDHFVQCIDSNGAEENINSFSEAAITDRIIAMMIDDAQRDPLTSHSHMPAPTDGKREKRFLFGTGGARH
ncbi:MAG TPA: Gfo/Idh/MocA family oxidoreductase [Noviherbaspirillum sp.]|nr:Gfo/Idh/MocA family oxidoreductase [Noviherbaspirillum sp.]